MDRRLFVKGVLSMLPMYAFSGVLLNTRKGELLGLERPKLVGNGYLLVPEASAAFDRMCADALKDGIHIKALSSYRDFYHQQSIWNRKYSQFIKKGHSGAQAINKVIEYTAVPGTSRHHWGTEVDITSIGKAGDNPLQSHHYNKGALFGNMRAWMVQHASNYGFIETYTNDAKRTGFHFEPWHYSYAPLSKKYLKEYLELQDAVLSIQRQHLKGEKWLDQAFFDRYLPKYMQGINPLLL